MNELLIRTIDTILIMLIAYGHVRLYMDTMKVDTGADLIPTPNGVPFYDNGKFIRYMMLEETDGSSKT